MSGRRPLTEQQIISICRSQGFFELNPLQYRNYRLNAVLKGMVSKSLLTVERRKIDRYIYRIKEEK